MEKIRDLKVCKGRDSEGNEIWIEAAYLRSEKGTIFYKEDGILDVGVQYNRLTCKDCIHKKRFFIFNTNNIRYHLIPLPSHAIKCEIIDKTYSNYDILTHENSPVCENFVPSMNYPEWNINQFIDIPSSCKVGHGVVRGISYKNIQAPFQFEVSRLEWYKMDFIHDNKIKIKNPMFWDEFSFEGETRKSKSCYYKDVVKNPELEKDIECALHSNWQDGFMKYGDKTFDFETMWFTANE